MNTSTKSSKNVWNDLASGTFNTQKNVDECNPRAADNILIAWPIILKFINNNFNKNEKILDFGCGTGSFCKQLHKLGFNVTGVDYAQEMINISKSYAKKGMKFYDGDASQVLKISKLEGKFDGIISIMVFQFIENIEETIKNLTDSIHKGGAICFAVFNKEYVRICNKREYAFQQLKESDDTDEAILNFGKDNDVLVYNRKEEIYDRILEKYGFKKNTVEYPSFTEEFVKKYTPDYPIDIPEFMILGYKK